MLTTHFKIKESNVEWLKSLNQVIYMFNKQNQTIITDRFACKLNNLNYSDEDKEILREMLN